MAFSSSNPFAPKEKEKPSPSGIPSVTVKSNGTPSPQPSKITTQKTYGADNPFATPTTVKAEQPLVIKPKAPVPPSPSKIPVQTKKESYLDSLKRNFPKFLEGFVAPFTNVPEQAKTVAKVADKIYRTGQAGIALGGATGGGTVGSFTGRDNLYKEYKREGYSPWQSFVKTAGDIGDLQKQAVKNAYTDSEANIKPLAEQLVKKAVKKNSTVADKLIGYGGAGFLKFSELLGNVFNLPVLDSVLSARVKKVGDPTYIQQNSLAEQGLNPAGTFGKDNVVRMRNPYAGDEYIRFTRLKDGVVKVDNFQVEASPAEKLLGKFFKPKTDIIEGEIIPSATTPSAQLPAKTTSLPADRPLYTTQNGNIEHGMDLSNLDDALKGGLKPDASGRVFMAETRGGVNQAVDYENLTRNPKGIRLVMSEDVQGLSTLDVSKMVGTGDVAVSETVKPNMIQAIVVRPDLYDEAAKIVKASGKNIPIFLEQGTQASTSAAAEVQPVVHEITVALSSVKPTSIPLTENKLFQAPFAANLINRAAESLDHIAEGLGSQLKEFLDPDHIENVQQIQSGMTHVLEQNGLIEPPPVKFEGLPPAESASETAITEPSVSQTPAPEAPTASDLTGAEPSAPTEVSTQKTTVATAQPPQGQLSIPGVERLGAVAPHAVQPAINAAIRPPAELITRREDVLLRQRIRAEVRGSKAGFKAGVKLTREALTEKFRQQTESMQQIRNDLTDFIKQELPAESRGKFLDSIKKDLTLRQQFRMIERVEGEKNKLIRAEIIPRLKKMSELTSETVAVKYKKSLNELLSKLDFKKPTARTKRSLSSLRAVLDADPEFAKLHPDLIKNVERLTRQPVADLSTAQLKELDETAQILIERGKLMHDLETLQNERKLKIATEKFAASTAQVSETASLKDMSQIERMKYESRRATYGTLHTMRWARIFDGYKANGENLKAIKDLSATENYSNDQSNLIKQDMLDRISQITNLDEITDEMQVRITARSLVEQGKISEAAGLLKAYPVEGVEDVSDLQLTEQEQQLLDVGRQIIKDHLEAKTIATYETLENQIFPKVENYTPIFYEGETNLLSSEVVERQKFSRRNVEKGFTLERQQNVDKIPRHDFFGMIADHIDSALWYINMQPKLKLLARVTQSEEYLNAGGSLAVEQWRKLIDVVARRGFSANYQANWWLKKLRINLSQAQLGFRVTSMISQPFAVFDGMAAAQTQWGPRATAEVMKEFMQSWLRPGYSGEIIKNSPALNQRQGGELAITESLRAIEEAKTWYQKAYGKFVKGSFALLQRGDVKTAAGVQKGIQNILERNGIKDAQQEAEFFMNMVSASSNVTLRPTVLATGDLARLWFTFQTFVMNRWGVVWEDIIKDGVVHGDWKKKMNALMGLAIMMGGIVAEESTRRKVKELMGGGNQNQQTMTEYALTAIPSLIPYFGSAFQLFSPFDPSVSPAVVTTIQRGFKGVQSMITGKKDETKLKGISSAVQALITLLFGIPGSGQVGDLINNAAFPKPDSSGSIKTSVDNPFLIP